MKKLQLKEFLSRIGKQWKCDVVVFILLYSVANAALFQGPLYQRAASSLDVIDLGGISFLLTLFVFQLLISITVLTTVSLLSIRLTKWLCALLLLGNSVGLYFILTYGVILDATMMGNLFNSNFDEASQFAHPKLLLYMLLLGAVPAIAISKIEITKSPRSKRFIFLSASFLIGASWIYANSKSWLWIDKNAKQLGGLILPWSYVVNSARHYDQTASKRVVQRLLPEARLVDPEKVVVVLIIGESARAQNFSLYGYHRTTNPQLSKASVVVVPNVHACATYTTRSLQCMLSHLGTNASSANIDEPLPSYLYRHGVEVIWRTNNFGEPPMKVGSYQAAVDIRKECAGDCQRLNYDEVLLYKLDQQLRNSQPGKKMLVVLHQTGSHGPQYFRKYPPEFEAFRPVCRTVDQQKCSPEELVNAYDNSILYTDYLLSQVIELLKSLENTASVMLYVSDHGESLGEHGLYLHGIPYSIAPDVQKNVPFIVWTSDTFAQRRHLQNSPPESGKQYSHDYVFHSVMGALGLESDIYKADMDIFHAPPFDTPALSSR